MRGSQRASAERTAPVTALAVRASLTPKTRSWIPQPKSGRMTRSPGAVDRMVQIDLRIPSSGPGVRWIWPPASRPSGKSQPRPRKPGAVSGRPLLMLSPDHHGAGGDHLADRRVGRVVAGHGGVAGAGGGLVVDHHRLAADLDRALVRRLLLEAHAVRDVLRGVVGGAADDRGRLAHDLDVRAQPAADHARERVRQRRGGLCGTCLHHDDVRVHGDDPIALLGSRLPHPLIPRQLMLTIWPLTLSCAFALRSRFWAASIFTAPWALTSTSLPLRASFPLVDFTVMSASAAMVMVLSLVLMTMLFLPDLSTISIISAPDLSVRRITWPLRLLSARTSFLPSALLSGGLSLPFHSPPSTYGESGRPCS